MYVDVSSVLVGAIFEELIGWCKAADTMRGQQVILQELHNFVLFDFLRDLVEEKWPELDDASVNRELVTECHVPIRIDRMIACRVFASCTFAFRATTHLVPPLFVAIRL